MKSPFFWKTTLKDVDMAVMNAQKCSEKRILTLSAGGRPVHMLAYGEKKQYKSAANYSSACGAGDRSCFNNPKNTQRTLVLIGAVHGQEMEGIAALMDLISLLETGRDLAGNPNDTLLSFLQAVRLVIVPVANPDGRARVEPDALVGMTDEDLRYWGQGTWKDGTYCGYPDCKKVHPIGEAAGFLGGYFNDDGININADNYFHCMAKETQAILDLCAEEQADMVLHLHGGSNLPGTLLQAYYLTQEANEAIYNLSCRCNEVGEKENLNFGIISPPKQQAHGKNPPAFDFVCAVHHVCGAWSMCYESNQCIIDEDGPHRTHAEIIRMHMILFEQAIKMLLGF